MTEGAPPTIPTTLAELAEPINTLKHYARNPRRGNVDAIRASLEAHGQYRPIVANERTREVLAGNHTLAAARELGWPTIAVTWVDVDDDTAARIAIIDNRASDLAVWDEQQLADLLRGLPTLDGTGYDDRDLERLLRDLDDARDRDTPPRPARADVRTRRGELVELGRHRLMCGDATSPGDVERLLAGERVALVFTSPPYLDLRDYDAGLELDPQHLATFLDVWAPHADLIAVNLGLIVREHAIVAHWDVYLEAASAAGLKLLAWNVWNREDATNIAAQQMMFPPWHEFVFVFGERPIDATRTLKTKHAGRRQRLGQRQRDGSMAPAVPLTTSSHKRLGSVLTMPCSKGAVDGDHPAVFPVGLPLAYIDAVTLPGDTVADSFAGSGTTLIAAENAGRAARLMELDPAYCDVIVDRYRDHAM